MIKRLALIATLIATPVMAQQPFLNYGVSNSTLPSLTAGIASPIQLTTRGEMVVQLSNGGNIIGVVGNNVDAIGIVAGLPGLSFNTLYNSADNSGSGGWDRARAPQAVSTDAHGTTSGTANTFTTLLAASTSRRGCLFANTSTAVEYVFINTTGSLTPTVAASFPLNPGGSYSCGANGVVDVSLLQIAAASASSTYAGVSQ